MVLLNHYIKGAAYGSSGTYGFAMSTPATLSRFYESDDVINQYQAMAINTDTQSATVTLLLDYYRHYLHVLPKFLNFNINLNICL